jgi:hypothetical protein
MSPEPVSGVKKTLAGGAFWGRLGGTAWLPFKTQKSSAARGVPVPTATASLAAVKAPEKERDYFAVMGQAVPKNANEGGWHTTPFEHLGNCTARNGYATKRYDVIPRCSMGKPFEHQGPSPGGS